MPDKTNRKLGDVIAGLKRFKADKPEADKSIVQQFAEQSLGLSKNRSVYAGNGFAFRFAQAKGISFSNTVLSLSTLKRYDHEPLVVCIVRPDGLEFLFANTSFLKKISHSSHQLRIDNIKGSFLGHDIVRSVDGISNSEANFKQLTKYHQSKSWDDNLRRLVSATNAIVGTGSKFDPTPPQRATILGAPDRFQNVILGSEYSEIVDEIASVVSQKSARILDAANVDNVNLRGNTIEQIITEGGNYHALEDHSYQLEDGTTLLVDIKTKIMDLSSNPAGYNVDKVLKALADDKTVVAYLFVVIDRQRTTVHTKLLTILDSGILAGTRVQPHWAGRNSRGTAQLSCNWDEITGTKYKESVENTKAQAFLKELLEL